jgi:hypothetical protein
MSLKFQQQNIPHNCFPAGNCDVLDTAVHNNVRLSEDIVYDILDSDHLSLIFRLLDDVRTGNFSESVDKLTDWERFQSLASELI